MNTPLVMDLTNIHCLLIWSHLVEKDDIQLQRHVHKYNSAIKRTYLFKCKKDYKFSVASQLAAA